MAFKKLTPKVLNIILIGAILGAIGTLGYIIARPGLDKGFTEFYLLGPEGKATGYPEMLRVGEEGRVLAGITNQEGEVVSYRVEVRIEDVRQSRLEPVELGHNEKWEGMVGFTPHRAGDSEKVEFWLYRNGQSEPYLEPLYLWVKVTE